MSPRRGGPLARALRTLLAIVGAGALAVVIVVVALRALESTHEAAPARCYADGASSLAPDQATNAALIAGTTLQRGLPARAATIGIATAMQESRMRNIDYGDRDSLGMFQQRPSQGWGTPEQVQDPVYAVGAFYDALVKVPDYTELEVTVAAQAVQRSAFPNAYAQHETLARAWASALTGWTPASVTCTNLPILDIDPGVVAAAAAAQVERDYGVISGPSTADDGAARLVLDLATAPPPFAQGAGADTLQRLAWAVAQGAVAASEETGVGRVAVVDQVWTRASGAWEPSAAPLPTGQVVLGS